MQKSLIIKLLIIAGLCLIFGVGLAMIKSLVYERQRNAETVIQEITEQHVNAQQIITPFVIISETSMTCTNKSQSTPQTNSSSNSTNTQSNIAKPQCTETTNISPVLPSQTQAKQNLDVSDDTYKRGIYRSTSYQGKLTFNQKYQIKTLAKTNTPSKTTNTENTTKKTNQKATTLLIPISDLRGVSQMPSITINGKKYEASYPNITMLKGLDYLQVSLTNEIINSASNLEITVSIPLAGMSEIQTIPLGNQFMLSMHSNWKTPNFVGQALPNQKDLTDAGFDASWQNQHLAISNNKLLKECITHSQNYCSLDTNINKPKHLKGQASSYIFSNTSNKDRKYREISFNSFDVQFAKPNDVYLQTERSLKYGLLLLAISFGSFFLFEIIKSLRIHPIQYLLVSMALLVFYVLLLSLAEQIAFWQAYTIAGIACAGLIGWYAYYVLHSIKRAGLFTLILSAQYAGFFTILTIEELNLVIGAILCFIIIASVMYLTRKIDWYAIQ